MSAEPLNVVAAPANPFASLELPGELPPGAACTREEAEELVRRAREGPTRINPVAHFVAWGELVEKGVFPESMFAGPEPAPASVPGSSGPQLSQGNPRPGLRIVGGRKKVAKPERNLEAENATLAGMIANPEAIGELRERVGPEEFDGAAQMPVAHVLFGLHDEGLRLDPILIRDRLNDDPIAVQSGSLAVLEEVLKLRPPDVPLMLSYADVIHRKHITRAEERLRLEIRSTAEDGSLRNGQAAHRLEELIDRYNALAAGKEEHEAPQLRNWPEPADEAALHGVAGDVIRIIGPVTECDPMAILGQFLVAFGNMAGAGPCWYHEQTRQSVNLFMVVVGNTSTGLKGTSLKNVEAILEGCDEKGWKPKTGLVSGEGLIHQMRDGSTVMSGRDKILVDQGVEDKRALFVEHEFSSVLAAGGRQGNTLDDVIRKMWDGVDLGVAARNTGSSATGYHGSIIAHCTPHELLRRLRRGSAENGWANRWLWVCSRQSKVLPSSGPSRRVDWEANGVRDRIRAALAHANSEPVHPGLVLVRDEAAGRLWEEVKPRLNNPGPGTPGLLKARAKPLVMRLAAIYAVLDCSHYIRVEHLKAALAFWGYCERSVDFIFGEQVEGPQTEQDRAYQAIVDAGPGGMTLKVFNRTLFRGRTQEGIYVLNRLVRDGLVRRREEATQGRPRVVFVATSHTLSHSPCALSALSALSPPGDPKPMGDSGLGSGT